MAKKILEIKNLRTAFRTDGAELVAVDDVSYDVHEGQTVGVVGSRAAENP